MSSKFLALRRGLLICGSFAALIVVVLNLMTREDSSVEWIYTIEWVNRISFPILAAIFILWVAPSLRKIGASKTGKTLWALGCVLLLAIPFFAPPFSLLKWQYQYALSAAWGFGLIGLGVLFFMIAAKTGTVAASILCLLGSLALGAGALETALLFSSQLTDGISNLSADSEHAREIAGIPEYDSVTDFICGFAPASKGEPSAAFHREVRFDENLFDVTYRFNANGRRELPKPGDKPENDLLLFGCSFTFGHGLENEETWAWKLARLLGPSWRLENYAANGYSANQMLCLLQNRLVEPVDGKHRFALFFGIEDHLKRNDFFPRTPRYELTEKGEATRAGEQKYVWLFRLPTTFNGSQLAREISKFGRSLWLDPKDELARLFLAIIKQSDEILRNDYKTELVVLLWPDFAWIKEKIESLGIPVLLAENMLPEWDRDGDPGHVYRINRFYEGHPNPKATSELAEGLAAWFRERASSRDDSRPK